MYIEIYNAYCTSLTIFQDNVIVNVSTRVFRAATHYQSIPEAGWFSCRLGSIVIVGTMLL